MALGHSPFIVSDNLLFCMDAANQKCYNSSGTIITDLCGRNNLTMSNVTHNSSGIPYFNFNGTNSYCYNFSASNPLTSNSATVIAWINPNVTQPDGTYSGIFALGTKGCGLGGGNGQTLLFSMTSTRVLTMAKWCDDSYSSLQVPNNSWSMVSLIKNGAVTKFAVNETIQTAANTGTQNFAGSSFTIGCTDNPGRFYSGNIGLVALYNKALSDTEVLQNFNALRGRFAI
jgi:hypothetical protein